MKSWKTPTPEQVEKAVALLGHVEQYRHFLDRLENPLWIEPLRVKGFFARPLEPVRDEARNSINHPVWPDSRYLARMAKLDVAQPFVLSILMQLPETENILVHRDLAEAALAMPAQEVVAWVRKEIQWIEQREIADRTLLDNLSDLIGHMARGGHIDVAVALAQTLFALSPGKATDDAPDQEDIYNLPPEPKTRIDDWHYGEILRKNIPILAEVAPEQTFAFLCDLLDSYIQLTRRRDEGEAREDYLYIWRPAIETDEHDDLRNLLITAVRDAAEQVARTDPSQVRVLIERLEQRRWTIFRRLALHLLRRFPDTHDDLIAERLTDRTLFETSGVYHEYTLLAQEQFTRLSAEGQATILSWIDEEPDLEEYKKQLEQWDGQKVSDEEAKRYGRVRKRNLLEPLYDVLPAAWKQQYDELVAELGVPEHIETRGTWVGEVSPRSAEALKEMSNEDLVLYLKTWHPPDRRRWKSPSIEGLAQELRKVVVSDPERFVAEADRFEGCDPTYIRALVGGLFQAIQQGGSSPLPWDKILGLCRWALEQPRGIRRELTPESDEGRDQGWGWVHNAIADLLDQGIKDNVIPFERRYSAWKVLQLLAEDPEPTREYETTHGGSNMNPVTLSINTTRGRAMHAVVRYGLWVHRHIAEEPNGEARLARGFEEMPEVREVLETHLDLEQDLALAIRAVYGQWFPWLLLLDRQWAVSRISTIFPKDALLWEWWETAWVTYVCSCPPYDPVFAVLHEEYGRAIGQIGAWTKGAVGDPDERLAEHLMTLYWRGKLTLGEADGLLVRFYGKADATLRRHALDYVGRSIHRGEDEGEAVPGEVMTRLKILWEWRLEQVRSSGDPTTQAAELIDFGWWFDSGEVDSAWAVSQLTETLKLTAGKVEPDHRVVERLASFAENMPREAVECLRMIVEGDKEGWGVYGWRDHARIILATTLQGRDVKAQEAAATLISNLGTRGYLDFGELLQGGSFRPTGEGGRGRVSRVQRLKGT